MVKRVLILMAVSMLVLGACASDDSDDSASSTTSAGDGGRTESVTIGVTEVGVGMVLTDTDGKTIYAFDEDNGAPTCTDACAEKWPPVLAGEIELSAAVPASVETSTVEGEGGTTQVTINGKPAYTFGDDEPGQALCQGADGVWWVVGEDGEQIKA